MEIEIPKTLSELYSLTDRERFPSQHEEGRPNTLFYADFKTAEAFGFRAVYETMMNCGDLTERNPAEVTELYMVLNYLIWGAHKRGDSRLERFYHDNYERIDTISEGWSDADKLHFFRVTD